jgi:hypothetical protein
VFYDSYSSVFLLGTLLTAVVPLGLLVLAIIAVATGRGEEDPTGRRGYAIYLAGVLFITLFFSLFAVYLAADAVSDAIGDPGYAYDEFIPYDEFGEELDVPDDDDQTTRALGDAVEALLVALPAVLVFVWHQRRRKGLLAEGGFAGSPAERIDRAFLHAAAFTAVLVAVVSLAMVLPNLLSLAVPGFTEPGDPASDVREQAAKELIPWAVLLLGGALIFRWAFRQTPDGRPRPVAPGPQAPADGGAAAWGPTPAPSAPVAPAPAGAAPGAPLQARPAATPTAAPGAPVPAAPPVAPRPTPPVAPAPTAPPVQSAPPPVAPPAQPTPPAPSPAPAAPQPAPPTPQPAPPTPQQQPATPPGLPGVPPRPTPGEGERPSAF